MVVANQSCLHNIELKTHLVDVALASFGANHAVDQGDQAALRSTFRIWHETQQADHQPDHSSLRRQNDGSSPVRLDFGAELTCAGRCFELKRM